MKRFMVILVLGLGGCVAADAAMGVNEKGEKTGPGIIGTVASVLNIWIPGVVGLAGAATTAYAAIRAKNWKAAFVESAKVLEEGAAVGKTIAEIKPDLMVAHTLSGVGPLVEKALDKYVRPVE